MRRERALNASIAPVYVTKGSQLIELRRSALQWLAGTRHCRDRNLGSGRPCS